MASIYKRGRKYHIEYFDASGTRRRKSSGTTDYRTAQRIANDLEAQIALRREGIISAKSDLYAEHNRTPLRKHVDAYVQHCEQAGRAATSLKEKKRHLDHFLSETGAARLSDVTADLLEKNLRALLDRGLSARSVNYRRGELIALMNWAERTGRVDRNPVKVVPKLHEEPKERRALTEKEVRALLDVAAKHGRTAFYLAALLGGLRRSEIGRLAWGDLDFERGTLTVPKGKAKRVDVIPLHPQLAAELLRIKPLDVLPSARVFPTVPSNGTRQEDFLEAKIALEDDRGRRADLHALRTTLGSTLANQGVPSQFTQRILRHADTRTTDRHYVKLRAQDLAGALGGVQVSPTPPSAHAATGTEGQTDCQQIRQQSVHGDLQDGATPCDGDSPLPSSKNRPRGSQGRRKPSFPAPRNSLKVEAAGGFEPPNNGFAIRRLRPLGHAASNARG